MNEQPNPIVFSLDAGRDFAARVAEYLGVQPGEHEEREFEDGEHKIRPLQSVRGADVYLVQSLTQHAGLNINDVLCRSLFFLAALRDDGAASVTAVLPYLCYSRKDRRTKPRDPVTTRYLAAMLESSRLDRVVTIDVHNLAAYQNAFRCQTLHLEATPLFIDDLRQHAAGDSLTVASPDAGGTKRAELFRQRAEQTLGREVGSAFVDKQRNGGVVSGGTVVGDVKDRTVVILDDLVATGTTLARAARAFREQGAEAVIALATHGVFSEASNEQLAEPALSRIVVTNTIPPGRISAKAVDEKLTVLDAAPLIGDTIRRLHFGESLPEGVH